jgi:hypothetical protein
MTPQEIAAAAGRATAQVRTLDARGQRLGGGTGFFTSPDGMITTNYHVIENAQSLQVETVDGEIFDNVFYVTADARRDIAILKIPIEGAISLRLGRDADVDVGAKVYVMGNPLGQTGTFSDGLVNSRRTIEGVVMLQISAPISPGSSGGPVMDERGEVIGIATMMLQGGQNLNFAVPVRYVRPLLSTGETPRRFTASLLPRTSDGLANVGNAQPPVAAASPSRPAPRPAPRTSPRPAATEEWEAQVIRQLNVIEGYLAGEGYNRSHGVVTGSLRQYQSEEIRTQLYAGMSYGIVGVCDNDCSDLDLRVYSPSGTLLERDTQVSEVPVVLLTPRANGSYKTRVTMSACSAAPCRYGISTFVQ